MTEPKSDFVVNVGQPSQPGLMSRQDYQAKYTCCCSNMQLKTGALVICILEMFVYAALFFRTFAGSPDQTYSLYQQDRMDHMKSSLGYGAMFSFILAALTLYGVLKKKTVMIFIQMIKLIIQMILTLLYGVGCILIFALAFEVVGNSATSTSTSTSTPTSIVSSTSTPTETSTETAGLGGVAAIVCVTFGLVTAVFLLVEWWFFTVFRRLHRNFKEEEMAGFPGQQMTNPCYAPYKSSA